MTKTKPELITDPDIYIFFERKVQEAEFLKSHDPKQ